MRTTFKGILKAPLFLYAALQQNRESVADSYAQKWKIVGNESDLDITYFNISNGTNLVPAALAITFDWGENVTYFYSTETCCEYISYSYLLVENNPPCSSEDIINSLPEKNKFIMDEAIKNISNYKIYKTVCKTYSVLIPEEFNSSDTVKVLANNIDKYINSRWSKYCNDEPAFNYFSPSIISGVFTFCYIVFSYFLSCRRFPSRDKYPRLSICEIALFVSLITFSAVAEYAIRYATYAGLIDTYGDNPGIYEPNKNSGFIVYPHIVLVSILVWEITFNLVHVFCEGTFNRKTFLLAGMFVYSVLNSSVVGITVFRTSDLFLTGVFEDRVTALVCSVLLGFLSAKDMFIRTFPFRCNIGCIGGPDYISDHLPFLKAISSGVLAITSWGGSFSTLFMLAVSRSSGYQSWMASISFFLIGFTFEVLSQHSGHEDFFISFSIIKGIISSWGFYYLATVFLEFESDNLDVFYENYYFNNDAENKISSLFLALTQTLISLKTCYSFKLTTSDNLNQSERFGEWFKLFMGESLLRLRGVQEEDGRERRELITRSFTGVFLYISSLLSFVFGFIVNISGIISITTCCEEASKNVSFSQLCYLECSDIISKSESIGDMFSGVLMMALSIATLAATTSSTNQKILHFLLLSIVGVYFNVLGIISLASWIPMLNIKKSNSSECLDYVDQLAFSRGDIRVSGAMSVILGSFIFSAAFSHFWYPKLKSACASSNCGHSRNLRQEAMALLEEQPEDFLDQNPAERYSADGGGADSDETNAAPGPMRSDNSGFNRLSHSESKDFDNEENREGESTTLDPIGPDNSEPSSLSDSEPKDSDIEEDDEEKNAVPDPVGTDNPESNGSSGSEPKDSDSKENGEGESTAPNPVGTDNPESKSLSGSESNDLDDEESGAEAEIVLSSTAIDHSQSNSSSASEEEASRLTAVSGVDATLFKRPKKEICHTNENAKGVSPSHSRSSSGSF